MSMEVRRLVVTVGDVPPGRQDDVWSVDHFDTMTVMVPGRIL